MIFTTVKRHEAQAPTAGTQGLRLSESLRTALLFMVAAALGGLGWSGRPALNYLALLFPFIYLYSRRRLDTLSAAFYYAAATWSIVPASRSFFDTGSNLLQPLLIWFALTAISSAPWIALYSRRFLPLSAIAALVILVIPPLSLVTVMHPLIATGQWFPGTRWFGVALPLLLIAGYRRLGSPATLAILVASSLAVHARFHRPAHDPSIVPLNTHFGAFDKDQLGLDSQAREIALQRMVLAYPNALVLLPESVLPGWSLIHEMRWAETLAQLKRQHTGLLIGTTLPVPNTQANRNVLLSRGYIERLSYVQRVPVPLGMWRLGSEQDGFPLMLRFPPTIRVWNHRAGVLICYEQLLVWPALETLSRNPDMLLAPSNLYWASNTTIPAIQHVSAQDWADLWAIPLYEASNR
ncbi:MAG: hypothetical protein M3Y72_02215 [Acidobacteriota bacterium]|nr:hypothetical protein [Acidobacteriota bacterium]